MPEFYAAGEVAIKTSIVPFNTLLMIQLFMCQFVELKRLEDFKKPKSQGEPGSFFGLEGALACSGVNGYPGGPFDPLNLSNEDYKWKEIRNGRLAMLAFVGEGEGCVYGVGRVV